MEQVINQTTEDENPIDDGGFGFWISEVNDIFSEHFHGLNTEDLPDYHYLDLFEDGFTPEEVLICYLEDNAYN